MGGTAGSKKLFRWDDVAQLKVYAKAWKQSFQAIGNNFCLEVRNLLSFRVVLYPWQLQLVGLSTIKKKSFRDFFGQPPKKNCSPHRDFLFLFFIWCYVDTIRMGQEIKFLPYAGFFLGQVKTKSYWNLIFTQLIVIDDL